MQQQENPLNYLFVDEEPINYRELIEKYVFHWKWFALGVLVAVVAAFLYLRYTPNTYLVNATILIDDETTGGLPSELSAFEDLGLMGGAKKQLETEMGLLKSRSLMGDVVKELGLNVTYYKKGRIREVEVYKNNLPFNINFLNKDSVFYKTDTSFSIQAISATSYQLKDGDGYTQKEVVFGEKVITDFGNFTITPTDLQNVHVADEIIVRIQPIKDVAGALRENIQVELLYKKSSLIELSLKNTVKLKAIDILSHLVQQYNKEAVADKNLIGNNTEAFINERLAVIEQDLSAVDKGVETFKTSNKLTDISSEAGIVLEGNAQLEKEVVELHTQLKLANYMGDYLTSNPAALIPANLGISDGSVSANSTSYNELLLERNRILKGSSTKHPIIVNLDAQLAQLRASINQGLVNLKSSLTIAIKDAENQERRFNSKIVAVPKQEREFRDIQRQQQIIETLYLYLLQKREENAISLAVTVPNAKVIDVADGSTIPVSPKRKVIYLAAVLLGLLIPFVILYIRFLLDNKVHVSKDVEAVVKAPFLGEVPKTNSEHKIVVTEKDRDAVSESFRMLRTNLNFMLAGVTDPSKVIFITSTIPGEGKTFLSLNLAAVLALSNKKVLLVGADVRKPKLNEYLKLNEKLGLTQFLMDTSLKVPDVIHHFSEGKFDILSSGIVPPNPSELLMNGRFDEVLAYGKEHYDYIIVDTAPVKMVTDTLLLSHHANLCLYIIRANYLDKRLLEIPEKMYKEKRLPNMAVVMNDVDMKLGYGYGYGYGYGGYGEDVTKKPWWKRWLS
ncbi:MULTISPECIES: GumC family protein [Flavobacteriaceae]|uniref:non-specific protein-tyrosine kinase n=2 Tax=Flavobacteriaceae TaxID=49546 RepID=A0A4Y8AYB5_9FLAO|nr:MULTISPECIES: tyrosine-protein kinase [Flavobacteriaceae]TEW77015.1 polysaccharide biosynthesis tyrosine autokinase [Gramella jeungdoensis]GGK58591.1 tyrosine protein kinase [Lutibacter litoralis]